MNCKAIETEDVAERYVRGELTDPEREAYEEHYYQCASCFEELQVLQAVKAAAPPVPAGSPGRRFLWFGAIAAAAVLAVVGGSRIWRGTLPPRPAITDQAAVSRDETLRLLARVEPPRYTAPSLRGSGEADRRFRAAMESYTRADYAAAAQGLQEAVREDAKAAGPRFYLGVCELILGQADNAIAELKRADEAGPTPYQEPARFFLAKALLAKHDLAGAERALVLTTELTGDREMEARRLLEQVRALQSSK